MRSASIQFAWFTPEEARRAFERMAPTADNYGDRLALLRRFDPPPSPPPLTDWAELYGSGEWQVQRRRGTRQRQYLDVGPPAPRSRSPGAGG